MQNRAFLLSFFLLIIHVSNLFSGTHIEHRKGAEAKTIGKGIFYLRQIADDKTIDYIIANQKKFEVYENDVLNFENTKDFIWLQFSLLNPDAEALYLQLGNPELDNISCYGVRNDSVIWTIESGNKHPFYSRYLRSNRVSIPIGSTNITIYLKLSTRSSFYLPLYVGTIKSLSNYNHKDDLFNGACMGIMLIMLLYNFFIFLSVQNRVYLQYCLYLFFSTSLLLFIESLPFDLLWREDYTINNFYFTNIMVVGATASAIWFSATFLRIQENAPKVKWINYLLLAALAICLILDLSGSGIMLNLPLQIISGITSFYLLILGLILFLRGFKEARFYVFSWGILVSGALVYILTLNGFFDINFYTINSFQISSMAESVLLSFALADRINTFRREKHLAQKVAIEEAMKNEQLIRNQNVVLEREVEKRTRELQAEMKKSEDLLHHILPHEVAQELKESGVSEARLYKHVTVLFTDFVNFTGIGENLSPKDLVKEINHCFKAFDGITDTYGLEKIKTIGDAYLAVCGLPLEEKNHAVKVTLAALEISAFMKKYHDEGGIFQLRIGINSGPVVAGIVGVKKFAYDIWGDTVNIAARLESNDEIGKVNISKTTYDLIKSDSSLTFEYRGMVSVKGKGEMEMWFVEKR